jgi:hypothetical protein
MVRHQDKTAASLCCQVAALILNMLCNYYIVITCKIAKNSTTTKDGESEHRFGILKMLEMF